MLDWCEEYLAEKGDENPRVAAQTIVSHVTGMSRIELFMSFDRELTPEQLDTLRPLVKRRGTGEPLQYILGTAPFRYLDVIVRPGVLIPRPETEVLVSEVLAALPAAERRIAADSRMNEYDGAAMIEGLRAAAAAASEPQSAKTTAVAAPADNDDEFPDDEPVEQPGDAVLFGGSSAHDDEPSDATESETAEATPVSASTFEGLLVADICTGSGCIACSMASERPDIRVVATDLSADAVALARENAIAAGVADRVGVLQGDLGTPIETARPAFMGAFDAVISNPPYIPSAVLAELPLEVADYEPELALDGGDDGLDLFRRLTPWALHALKPSGVYACELHETCLDDAAAIAQDAGFSTTRVVNDLTGRPRVLVCRK